MDVERERVLELFYEKAIVLVDSASHPSFFMNCYVDGKWIQSRYLTWFLTAFRYFFDTKEDICIYTHKKNKAKFKDMFSDGNSFPELSKILAEVSDVVLKVFDAILSNSSLVIGEEMNRWELYEYLTYSDHIHLDRERRIKYEVWRRNPEFGNLVSELLGAISMVVSYIIKIAEVIKSAYLDKRAN